MVISTMVEEARVKRVYGKFRTHRSSTHCRNPMGQPNLDQRQGSTLIMFLSSIKISIVHVDDPQRSNGIVAYVISRTSIPSGPLGSSMLNHKAIGRPER